MAAMHKVLEKLLAGKEKKEVSYPGGGVLQCRIGAIVGKKGKQIILNGHVF